MKPIHRYWVLFMGLLGICYLPLVEDGGLVPRQLYIALGVGIGYFFLPQKTREQVSISWPELGLLAWWGIMTASTAWAQNKGEALAWAGRWAALLAFYLWVKTLWQARILTWDTFAFGVCCFITLDYVWVFSQAIPLLLKGDFWEKISLVSGSHGNKNILSIQLYLLIPPALWAMREDLKPRWFFRTLVGIGMVFMIALQTKAIYSCIILSGLHFITMYLLGKLNPRIYIIGMCTYLAIFFTVLWGASTIPTYRAKLETNQSLEERFDMWDNTRAMIAEHPLLGVGAGNWQVEVPKYGVDHFNNWKTQTGLVTFQRPHNDYLWLLAEGGVLTLLLYLLFIYGGLWRMVFKVASRNRTHYRLRDIIVLGVLLGYTKFSQGDYPLERPEIQVFVLTLLAYAYRSEAPQKWAIPGWSMLLFAGIGITLGISRFSNERLILALKKESKKGQGDKLLATYAKINPTFCTLDATSAPLAWYAGAVYEQKGNYPEALSLYRKGLQAAPYHFRTINSLGIAYFRLGQADSALFYFNKAQQMATQWDEPIYNLAAVLHQQNKNLEAFRLLAKLPAVITDPRAETFKSVLFKARLDEARPGETPSNQARIDTLLADPLYPYKAHAKYQASGKSDTFWR